MYTRWSLSQDLAEWIKLNITPQTQLAGFQIIKGDVPLHTDKRKWALNYLVDCGGDAVQTSFHHIKNSPLLYAPASRPIKSTEEIDAVCNIVIQSRRWHILNTNVLHTVSGTSSTRSAVTIGLNSKNPFDDIIGYKGLL